MARLDVALRCGATDGIRPIASALSYLCQSSREGELRTWPERRSSSTLATARSQEALFFELRAALDLAQLLTEREERQAAADLLSPILGWFSVGFDLALLIGAKAQPEALHSSREAPLPLEADWSYPSPTRSWCL